MGKARKIPSAEINLPKTIVVILSVYVFAIICFYFLADDQIRFRESRGNITMQPIQGVAAELSAGITIEQLFYAPIQRLESVSVQWGTYYRTNAGTVYMDLIRQDTGETIMSGAFDVSTLGEHEVLTLSAPTPIETINKTPLILRLTSDSEPGSSVAPLTNLTPNEGFNLFVNGQLVDGMLCFSASGTDNIWMGFHYWEFAAGLGGLQILFFTIVWLRWRSGKRSYIVNAFIAIKKYRFLIRQLVARDFKTKYKRSLLGVFWSFLNPLLMMLVQYFVFSTIFRNDIPFFAAYLIIGTVMFNFLSESCGMTLSSILGNAGLITKVYMPKYIYPLTRTMSSVVNLAISLIPMTLVCLGAGVQFRKAAILALFFFVCLIVFCLGLGLLLATSMVFFRDTQFLWNVVSMMWMYATPIFYPERIIPDNLKFVLNINPLYQFLSAARMCILTGLSPEPIIYFKCMGIALGMLLAGAIVFYRNQDKFVLYL